MHELSNTVFTVKNDMKPEEIESERRGPVLWIYLNRPKSLNAMTLTMLEGFARAFDEAFNDDTVRVVVLSGRGRAFCVGTDLAEVSDPTAPPTGVPGYLEKSQALFERLRAFHKPVIAALNGTTCAGGLELAFCCDLIYASRGAKVGDAHSNFGLLPGAGNSVWLSRLLGPMNAKHLLFTGDLVPAETLAAQGLLRVVDDDALEVEVQALAERLAAKSGLVLRRMKELVRDTVEQPLDVALRHEFLVFRQHTYSHDCGEGVRAFNEKRTPRFKDY